LSEAEHSAHYSVDLNYIFQKAAVQTAAFLLFSSLGLLARNPTEANQFFNSSAHPYGMAVDLIQFMECP
jgi:hypothetical protein